jgi:hypothetical protein
MTEVPDRSSDVAVEKPMYHGPNGSVPWMEPARPPTTTEVTNQTRTLKEMLPLAKTRTRELFASAIQLVRESRRADDED